jgi:predicted secreted protein
LTIGGKALGGQQNATLSRQAEIIDITNKIQNDWSESLTGRKSWSINCAGIYVVDDEAFDLIEDAFLNNKKVQVSIAIGTGKMVGEALIVDFPLNAVFNQEFKYSIKLLGTGPLVREA